MCCLVGMLFIREFVDVLSGVDVVYTRMCICAVWCECRFKREFVDVLSGVDVVYTRIC